MSAGAFGRRHGREHALIVGAQADLPLLVVRQSNSYRAKRGLSPLGVLGCLASIAVTLDRNLPVIIVLLWTEFLISQR